MTEVLVPYDTEAERSVLGAIMMSPAALDDVLEVLEPGDMYDVQHETVYAAVRRLHEHSRPTDVIAVGDELGRAGELRGVLDVSYLHTLTSAVPTAANAAYYAAIVHEHAVRRRLLTAGSSIVELAGQKGVNPADAVEIARERVDAVAAAGRMSVRVFGESAFDSFVSGLDEKPKYVPTPWWDINKLLGGYRAGGLYTVGARPGQGKSIIGLQSALRLAKEGPVAFISLEMSRDDLMARLIAQMAQVSLHALVNHEVSREGWQRIAMVRSEIQRLPLYVSTSDEVSTITQVRAFARSVARKGTKDKPLAGVVVDYLQLLTSSERVESRQVEVSGFSRSLKLMAQSLGVPVIALSQLNRGSQNRRSPRPTLADLRESGAIEQDSDCVLLLHRDEKNAPNRLDVDVAKNRQGENGRVSLAWEGTFSRVMSQAKWTPESLLDERAGKD